MNLNDTTHTFRETRTKETRNLFDKGLRSQESVVFLGELLDKLLVLVEPAQRGHQRFGSRTSISILLQVIDGHVFELNLLGTINVGCISENTNGHARAGNVGQSGMKRSAPDEMIRRERSSLYSARETFVSLGVIVLETDLELDCFHKVAPFLVTGGSKKLFDGAPHA